MTSEPTRFWAKVNRTETCWLWTGSLTEKGYGRVQVNGINTRAHRVAYELLVGPIGGGLVLDHLCRVRHCVNPSHLEPVTPTENTRRGESSAAMYAARTHCPVGHEFSTANTRARRDGTGRECVPCKRAYETARSRRRRAASRAAAS